MDRSPELFRDSDPEEEEEPQPGPSVVRRSVDVSRHTKTTDLPTDPDLPTDEDAIIVVGKRGTSTVASRAFLLSFFRASELKLIF